MRDKLIALVAGAILGLLVGAAFNDLKAAEPLTRSERIAALTASTGELLYRGDKICSLAKRSPGVFLTARHCVEGMNIKELTVRYKAKDTDFYGQTRELSWLGYSNKNDLALVTTVSDIDDMKALELSCGTDIVLGQDVAAMGYPSPMGRYYTEGYVNSVAKTDYGDRPGSNFWMDLRAAPGSSGGPVVDAKTGKQIGVLVEIMLPPKVGNIASGAEGISVTTLCGKGGNSASPFLVPHNPMAVDDKDYGYSPF